MGLVEEHPFPYDGTIYFHIKVVGQESLLGDQITIVSSRDKCNFG
jgi:hypothetical protein